MQSRYPSIYSQLKFKAYILLLRAVSSQYFHMKRLVIQDNVYLCPEQYIQSQKAKLFKCYNTVKQVLEAKSPIQIKNLCKNLPGFDRELWKKEAPKIARVCLQATFQDTVLKNYLLSTGMKTLIEASPHDKVWGIGFSIHYQQILQRKRDWGDASERFLCKWYMEIAVILH